MIASREPFTGRKFLALLLGLFLVVAAVNGLMIWYALSSWTGLVSDSAYEDGLGFDRVLAACLPGVRRAVRSMT